MRNITEQLDDIYLPKKALVINVCKADESRVYVEAYDFDKEGKPVNPHPLSTKEMQQLSESLASSDDLHREYLHTRSLLPVNLLYKDNKHPGIALWFTRPRKVNLLFKQGLKIQSGKAYVPSLVWKADADNLWIYALKTSARPCAKTQIYKAPFFNIHDDGKVCMGTVDVNMDDADSITAFMERWENYFWNSYFSHLLGNTSPVKGNIVALWQQQVGSKTKFPIDILIATKLTLNDLLK